MKSATVLLAGLGEMLERVGREKAGVVALAVAFGLGSTSAMGAVAMFGEYRRLPERVDRVEDWMVEHRDSVSRPNVRNIEANQERIGALKSDLAEIRMMVNELYCERFPERCEGRPARSGG